MLREYDPQRDDGSYICESTDATADADAFLPFFERVARDLGITVLYVVGMSGALDEALHLLFRTQRDRDMFVDRVNRYVNGAYSMAGF